MWQVTDKHANIDTCLTFDLSKMAKKKEHQDAFMCFIIKHIFLFVLK